MSISLIHDNYFPKFVPVNFLIQGNVTTIHKFGLIRAIFWENRESQDTRQKLEFFIILPKHPF